MVLDVPGVARDCAAGAAGAAGRAGCVMIAALLIGELSADPVARVSGNGNQFVTANLRVPAEIGRASCRERV